MDETLPGTPEPSDDVVPAEGVDAPEPVDVEPPVMPEPEPMPEPPSAPDFETPPPPPPSAPPAPTPPPAPQPGVGQSPFGGGEKQKVVAGVLAILLGSLGIHKFYLGYNKEGIIMAVAWLAASVISFGTLSWVVGVIGVVEGVIYLTKSDDEFQAIYVTGRRPWF